MPDGAVLPAPSGWTLPDSDGRRDTTFAYLFSDVGEMKLTSFMAYEMIENRHCVTEGLCQQRLNAAQLELFLSAFCALECPLLSDETNDALKRYQRIFDTVDGRNPAPVEVGSLSHYLQGFIDPRWCRISAINSIKGCLEHCTGFELILFIW